MKNRGLIISANLSYNNKSKHELLQFVSTFPTSWQDGQAGQCELYSKFEAPGLKMANLLHLVGKVTFVPFPTSWKSNICYFSN